jgi:hypothetical protein
MVVTCFGTQIIVLNATSKCRMDRSRTVLPPSKTEAIYYCLCAWSDFLESDEV